MKPLMVAGTSEATDSQLVEAARQDSDLAFEALFRRYRDRITAYVRGIVSDHARAEDIVQEVFMSALRSMRSSDREVAFKPWIYEIAKNACIDHIRRARRASEVSIDSDDFSPVDEGRLSAGVATTDAAYSARENLDALRMAFSDLPQAQREVLVSRELEGLSYDKISNRTGLSRSAVESMLFRARRTLKDGFEDIATGERCQRMQTVMVHLTDGRIGLRQERRLVRHLRDCHPCRREAVALGLDDLLFAAPSRARAVLSRVAAILPLPAFLRRRFIDGAGLLGSGSSGGAAEQGASLAGKAAVVLAAAAIAGGGAGVAEKSGVIGHSGSKAQAPAGQIAAPAAGSLKGSAPSAARPGARRTGGAKGSAKPGSGGSAAANRPGGPGSPGNGGNGGHGGSKGPLDPVGPSLGGTVGGAGARVGGALNGPVGGAANGAGGVVGNTVKGVGGAVGGAGSAIGGPAGNAVTSVGGAVTRVGARAGGTVTGVRGAVTGTVNGVTGLATGVTTGGTTTAQPVLPRLPKLGP